MNGFKYKPQILAGIKHEQGGLSQSMDSVIIGKFGNQNPVILVILSLVHKKVEELLDFLVDMFGLAIHLQVVGCGGHNFNPEYLAQTLHEVQHKLGPLSPTTSSGSLCNFQMPSLNSQPTLSEVTLDVVGIKWAHLDN